MRYDARIHACTFEITNTIQALRLSKKRPVGAVKAHSRGVDTP